MDFLKSQKMGNDIAHTEDGARASAAMDGLIEKVGLFAMEKQSISVDAVKENFSIDNTQAESIIKQLETIGVLGEKNSSGEHKVIMDKETFLNRVRGYQTLAERMKAVSASKNMNLSDVTISKNLIGCSCSGSWSFRTGKADPVISVPVVVPEVIPAPLAPVKSAKPENQKAIRVEWLDGVFVEFDKLATLGDKSRIHLKIVNTNADDCEVDLYSGNLTVINEKGEESPIVSLKLGSSSMTAESLRSLCLICLRRWLLR